MSTKASRAAMLATAQALAARSDCPTLPDTYVVEKGEPSYSCFTCGRVDLGPSEACHSPDAVDQTWPGARRLPDLRSEANAQALVGALKAAGVPHLVSWLPAPEGYPRGCYYAAAGGPPHVSEYLAEAAGAAWLAMRTTQEKDGR